MDNLEIVYSLMPRLRKIHDHFGHDNGLIKLVEECQEYIESMKPEEIADLFVLTARLVFHSQDLMDKVEYKIDRTIERIENGYYETMD